MPESPPHVPTPLLPAIVVEGGIGLLAVGLGAAFRQPPADTIAWELDGLLYGGACTVPLIFVMWLCIRFLPGPLRGVLHLIDEVVVPWFRGCRLWEFAVIAAFAGLGEEMLFRGVLQPAIADLFTSPAGLVIGWVAASVLFGLLHWATTSYAVLATLIGLYLGGLWILTGNLLVPVMVHALYDFWALIYLVRIRHQTPPDHSGSEVI